jgi:hypothetical protein
MKIIWKSVYLFFGALQERIASPGVHIKIPSIDSHERWYVNFPMN